MNEPIHIISLGAGVQSSTLALMAAAGEITPLPVASVFADTGDEPDAVYEWLEWLTPRLPFPVIRAANAMSLSAHVYQSIERHERVSKPPLFTIPDNPKDSEGLLTRDCTKDFKIAVIQRAARALMREHGVKDIVQWIGISLDETMRMKPSRVNYSTHRWPLIELRMTACCGWNARATRNRPVAPASIAHITATPSGGASVTRTRKAGQRRWSLTRAYGLAFIRFAPSALSIVTACRFPKLTCPTTQSADKDCFGETSAKGCAVYKNKMTHYQPFHHDEGPQPA
jgi:hypothetical protein